MKTIAHFVSLPHPCSYLHDRLAQLEYERVASMSAVEYQQRMQQGWRRFGHMIFRPVCRGCSECQSLRVLVNRFHPNRSQRRVRKLNKGVLRLEIGEPSVDREKLELYDRYHAFQSSFKDWPTQPPKDIEEYVAAFVDNPFSAHEYRYFMGDRLVAVSYVDTLPQALSAVSCYHDPELRDRSPGTWNVLSIIEQAALNSIPYVYLGYYVRGCRSLEYKAAFAPNQVRGPDGIWRGFREIGHQSGAD
jgi:arginine-tRNA-protein transferase